jgi:hypothetical protein
MIVSLKARCFSREENVKKKIVGFFSRSFQYFYNVYEYITEREKEIYRAKP